MTIVTREQLENASLDCQSIEDVINGAVSPGTVGTRIGGALKTLAKVLSDLGSIDYLGDWATATDYEVKDSVIEGGVVYLCVVAHTSGVFATDYAANRWVVYQSFSSSLIEYNVGLTGYLSRDVEDRLRERVSVLDFGAVGDGVTDDRGAIQAAFDAVASRETGSILFGKAVYIPAGEYLINDTLYINQQGFQFYGDGAGTVIKWNGSAGSPMLDIQDSSRVAVKDMTLIGDDTNTPSVGIYFHTPTIPTVGTNELCLLDGVTIGARYGQQTLGTRNAATVDGIKFGGAAVGNNDTWRIRNCWISGCTGVGIRIDNEQSIWGNISDCLITECATGILSEGSSQINNVGFVRSSVEDLRLNSGAKLIIIGYNSEQAEKLWTQQPDSTLHMYGGRALLNDQMLGNSYYAESLLGGSAIGETSLMLYGLTVNDSSATGTKLKIGASSAATLGTAILRGNSLPSGTSNTGYYIIGTALGTLSLDIIQGSYVRQHLTNAGDTSPISTWVPTVLGSRHILTFYQNAVTASQTNVSLPINGPTTQTTFVVSRQSFITGLNVNVNLAPTAGTLTLTVLVNGAATGMTLTLDGTLGEFKKFVSSNVVYSVAEGATVGLRITTTAGWDKPTASLLGHIEITNN